MCGQFSRYDIMFEYYDNNLLNDIQARASQDTYYSLEELQ